MLKRFWTAATGRLAFSVATAIILFGIAPPAILAQRIGDRLVVLRDGVAMTRAHDKDAPPQVVAELQAGDRVVVADLNAEAFLVHNGHYGWIQRTDVLPIRNAIARVAWQLEERPQDAVLLRVRAACHLDANDFDAASADLKTLLELAPDDSHVLLLRAELYLAQKHFAWALEDANAALVDEPGSTAAHFIKARALSRLGRIDEAKSAFEKAVELDPTSSRPLVYHAWLERKQNLAGAVAIAERAIELNPYDTLALAALGWLQNDQKNFDQSLIAYSRAVEIEPSAQNLAMRGTFLYTRGKLKDAEADLTRAVRKDGDNVGVRFMRMLSRAALELREAKMGTTIRKSDERDKKGGWYALESAIDDATVLIHEAPDESTRLNALTFRAVMFASQKKFAEAHWDAAELIRLRESPSSYLCRGMVHMMQGLAPAANDDHESAQRSLRAAAEDMELATADPEHGEESLNLLAILQFMLEEYDQAQIAIDNLIQRFPNSPRGYALKGAALIKQGHSDKALAALESAHQLDPDSDEIWLNRGVAHYKTYQYDKAEEDFSRRIHDRPDDAMAYYYRAAVRRCLDNEDAAACDESVALKLDPDLAEWNVDTDPPQVTLNFFLKLMFLSSDGIQEEVRTAMIPALQ